MDSSRSVLRFDIAASRLFAPWGDDPGPPAPRGECIGQAVCRSCGRPGGYPAVVIRWRSGTVTQLRREWAGTVEIMVTVHGRGRGPSHGPARGGVGSAEPEITAQPQTVRALAYPALTGRPEPGDRVLLNTTALHQGLGTGGYALVVAIPDRLPPDPELAGHVVKARYTPLQATVASADEQGSPYHDLLRDADSIDGMPVVVADLHSALPAILAGMGQGTATVAYVMQDGGALPAWFSRTIAGLRSAGWLAGTVTTGQSFGGDIEAVTVHSGLLAARHVLGADVAVVTQ